MYFYKNIFFRRSKTISSQDKSLCFCEANGFHCQYYYDEYGYFSLKELESITLPWGLKIERDLYFDPTTIEDIKSERSY